MKNYLSGNLQNNEFKCSYLFKPFEFNSTNAKINTSIIKKYPSIQHLAKADDAEVFKLWEGLGYYTRCKNLLHTARFIVSEYNGKFPDNYKEIVSLKGIGSYTASAIASFCFNLPYAVVDGNVLRILSRVFGIATPTDSAEGKKIFYELATKVLDT